MAAKATPIVTNGDSVTSPTPSTSTSASVNGATAEVENIKTSLLDTNESFDELLRYIPAKYYLVDEDKPEPAAPLTKAQKKAAKKKSGQADVKLAKSEALRKAKLARYDPNEPKTIPEIQAAKIEAALKGKSRASDASGSDWEDSDDGEDSDGEIGSDDEDSPNDTDFEDSDEEEITVPTGLRHPKEYKGEEMSITELRNKMKEKVAGMKSLQRAKGEEGEEVHVSKSGKKSKKEEDEENSTKSKEELMEERRKIRGNIRDNRRRKRKAERRDEKPKPKPKEGEREAPSNGRKGGGKANAPPKEPREEEQDGDRPRKKSKATPPTIKSAPVPTPSAVVIAPSLPVDLTPSTTPKEIVKKSKPAAPDASSLSFSTLDFTTTALLAANSAAAKGKGDKTKKNKHSLPKDPNAALEVLAKRKERLELLNPEQRERKEEKDRWEKVELKAGGEKVRDDEKRLKKMAKRQEKIKSKSAKAWAERKETVSSTINAKVAKRNTNLAARVKQAKDKKSGLKVKAKNTVKTVSKSFSSRNKTRAGFEGAKKKSK